MEIVEIQGFTFEVVMDYKEGWNPEVFKKRYSEILSKYDFIVGDWGYGQLRLKGFFHEDHIRATADTSISYLEEYLNEYCNFGCSYFILQKIFTQDDTKPKTTESDTVV